MSENSLSSNTRLLTLIIYVKNLFLEYFYLQFGSQFHSLYSSCVKNIFKFNLVLF